MTRLEELHLRALLSGGRRRVYDPKVECENRPWMPPRLTLPQEVHARRHHLVRELREILYRGAPTTVTKKRQMTWGEVFTEFCGLAHRFTYREVLEEAERFVELNGWADASEIVPGKGRRHAYDLEVWLAFKAHLHEVSKTSPKPEERKDEIILRAAVKEAQGLALDGICPVCGESLPCEACNLPAVKKVGGKVVAVD